MSTAKAQRVLLERFGSTSTVLLAVLIEGDAPRLIGQHQLGDTEAARDAVQAVVGALAEGHVPEGVHALALTPRASEAFATITEGVALGVADRTPEFCVHGGRGSGKTVMVIAALGWLGEQRRRAGYTDPLKVMWVQDSLKNATEKTGASLEEAIWGGCWSLREDRQLAVGGPRSFSTSASVIIIVIGSIGHS